MLKKKFKPAVNGLLDGFGHRSIVTQYVLGTMAVIAGFILRLTYQEWLAVIICIGLVIVTEYLNTAIEFTCDFLTTERDEQIKVIKDIAAGAVLVASLTALVTAIVILFHHI
ncbi:MAG: diacylglycerol kinase family protein [Solobacterium sp.]|nr:diacylglycerol kinase family protein [Solobacterium sp.]MBR3202768.1 diacylglycerol kinase family protein [Solobacterium sp.]MBR3345469.1 diacylglycerol kinase family protein [Solobacterium sp.]